MQPLLVFVYPNDLNEEAQVFSSVIYFFVVAIQGTESIVQSF